MNQPNKSIRKSTGHRMRILITFLTLLTLVLGSVGCSKETPRETVEKAFKKTFTVGNPLEALLGTEELSNAVNEKTAYSSGLSLSLQELKGSGMDAYAGFLTGLGFRLDTASDLTNKKSAGTLGITYGNTDYLTLGGQLNGSKLYLTVPKLLNGSVSVDFATLEDDLASDSFLAQLLASQGLTLPEGFSSNITEKLFSPVVPEIPEYLTNACDELHEQITVDKLKKEDVSLPDSVAYKNVYQVTVPQDAYAGVLDAAGRYMQEYMSSMIESMEDIASTEDYDTEDMKEKLDVLADTLGDLDLTVAVTKDGYISYIAYEVQTGADTLAFAVEFYGESAPLEALEATLELVSENGSISFEYQQEYDTLNHELTFSSAMTYDDQTLSFSGEGEFTGVEKGKKYTFDINYLEIKLADLFSVSLAGSYYLDTSSCEISVPSGTEYALFDMTQDDFTALAGEIFTNLQNDPVLSGLFGMFE